MKFKLKAPFAPAGDQLAAIEKLTAGTQAGQEHQVLLGVTGSGKTYTIANVIERTQKPVLVISHNKTLAAQLYQEFKEFFPQNGVGFFVSYYDYYQPEAYVPQTDTYIAKEVDINQEIDKLRLQATSLLFSRRDVIIVASVSCIYNIGSPFEYGQLVIRLEKGQPIDGETLMQQLVSLYYTRSRLEFGRGMFRSRGESIELIPAYSDEILRVEIEEGVIKAITTQPVLGGVTQTFAQMMIYPAKHYLANPAILQGAFSQIRRDLKIRVKQLEKMGKDLEAHRLAQRVKYDLEMMAETGYVNGIENYSRYFDGRQPGAAPWSLLDYYHHVYQDDFLVVIDESHMTIPQIRGMYYGDLSRREMLIDYGFRLPSCKDNRPLRFAEYLARVPQSLYVSATPAVWEISQAAGIVEQLVRPTGLVDPTVAVRPTKGQIQDLVVEIKKRQKRSERVLVTTLTKKMAEEVAWWLSDPKNTGTALAVQYLHADVDTLQRTDILADLRQGKYDVLVGVNLLREGLDLPEVSLVAILDADKQGFLRSKISLVQTMGRAARNRAGTVILYADQVSTAMSEAIAEVTRRRAYQLEYNAKHGITPRTISKPIRGQIANREAEQARGRKAQPTKLKEVDVDSLTPGDKKKLVSRLRREMRQAAAALEFEQAAQIRDLIKKLGR